MYFSECYGRPADETTCRTTSPVNDASPSTIMNQDDDDDDDLPRRTPPPEPTPMMKGTSPGRCLNDVLLALDVHYDHQCRWSAAADVVDCWQDGEDDCKIELNRSAGRNILFQPIAKTIKPAPGDTLPHDVRGADKYEISTTSIQDGHIQLVS